MAKALVSLFLFLLFLLAGCAGVQPTEPSPAPRADTQPMKLSLPIQVETRVHPRPVCTPDTPAGSLGCFNSYSGVFLAELEGNQVLEGFTLGLESEASFEALAASVSWGLACRGDCPPSLANATGPVPLQLHAEGLDLKGPLSLALFILYEEDAAQTYLPAANATVTGELRIDQLPGPPRAWETQPFSFDGVTGVCAFVAEPDCTAYPDGTTWELTPGGPVARMAFNATWTPSPTGLERLTLQIACFKRGYSECGVPRVQVTGTSPLTLDQDWPRLPPAATLRVTLRPADNDGITASRQEYHLEGFLVASPSGVTTPE